MGRGRVLKSFAGINLTEKLSFEVEVFWGNLEILQVWVEEFDSLGVWGSYLHIASPDLHRLPNFFNNIFIVLVSLLTHYELLSL